jgi:hypothetical protein
MLVVAVSALLALLFTLATRPTSEPARAAGEAKVQLLKDEHALIADSVRSIRDSAEAERLGAERSRAEMRALALAEIQKSPAAVPQAAVKPATTARIAMPLTKPVSPAAEPPLQLQTGAAPPSQKPLATRADKAFAAVRQIPHWIRTGVENVADWAMTVPAKAISQLPERRFL